MSNTSNTRLSTASSYSKNKAKKDLHPFYDSSASDQERRDASGGDELEDEVFGCSPQVSHTRDGSFSRKPATTTRQTPVEKKTKPQSARNTEKATTANPPSAKKRGTKKAKRPSTETGDSTEPAAKRPRVASERKAISSEESATSSTKHVDKDNHSRVETKTHEAKNDKAHATTLRTEHKSKERKYLYVISSGSEIEDEKGDEDDSFLPSRLSFQKKSPEITVPSPTFKTPATVANKVSELGTPKTAEFRLLPESVPPPRTPRRTLTLVKESSPNRFEQPISIPEDVANTELHNRSLKETPLIRPSTSRANGNDKQQLNDLENEIYAYGDDPELIAEVLNRIMLHSANSTNFNLAPLSSAIDPVPNRSPLRTQFNLYLASPGDPVRVQQLSNTAEHSLSLVCIQPKVVHALKINNPIMVVRLKGSVEFRSNPHAQSRILLNSSTRLVDLKAEAGILHVVNTGEEIAAFLLIETFQSATGTGNLIFLTIFFASLDNLFFHSCTRDGVRRQPEINTLMIVDCFCTTVFGISIT